MDRLEAFYGDLLAELPREEETAFELSGETCPVALPELETDKLVVRGLPEAHHYSDSVRAEVIDIFAEKTTFRALGLLVFSSIFHSTRTTVHLRQAGAEHLGGQPITSVVVDDPRREDPGPGVSDLRCVPIAYAYWPTIRTELNPLYSPWGEAGTWRDDLPEVIWSDESGDLMPSPKPRTVLHGFGLAHGAAKFAALLLDIGLPGSNRNRFALEGPAGYQSVTSRSAEVRLWIGYDRQ
jgi:hypothetical protein